MCLFTGQCCVVARLNIQYPMLFKLTNKTTKRETHCGVLEFIADEGRIYVPYWVSDGGTVTAWLCEFYSWPAIRFYLTVVFFSLLFYGYK